MIIYRTFDRETRRPLCTAQTREDAIAVSLPYGGKQAIFAEQQGVRVHTRGCRQILKAFADNAEPIN